MSLLRFGIWLVVIVGIWIFAMAMGRDFRSDEDNVLFLFMSMEPPRDRVGQHDFMRVTPDLQGRQLYEMVEICNSKH